MPKEAYIEKDFRETSLAIIDQANAIIGEYLEQGFSLTLRQLYYQFVARDLIPNTQKEYKRLGSILNDARLAGLVDWDAIEDRTRNLQKNTHWDSPAEIINSAVESFALDKWADQENYIEVWIEKEALIGVVEPVCREYDIPYFACRGYTSQSEQWRAGNRFAKVNDEGRSPIVFHLGDHDPSGIDMTRDNQDRLNIFMPDCWGVELKRLALNMDQVEEHNPPANPAKTTDTRFSKYIRQFGGESWELDALSPTVIHSLIEENILEYLDQEKWQASVDLENEHKARLREMAGSWEN